MNWMEQLWTNYLGFSYCCDGRCIAEGTTKLSLQIEKWEEDSNARDEAEHKFSEELEKAISLRWKVTSRMVNLSLEILLYVTTLKKRQIHKGKSADFEDKDLHDLSDLTPLAPQPKPEEPQEDYSKIILDISNHQDDAIVNHLHKFAGVILEGWARRSIVWWWKIDPKLVKFAKAAGE